MKFEHTLDDIFVLTLDGNAKELYDGGDLLQGQFTHVATIGLPSFDGALLQPFESSESGADWLIKKHKSLPPDQQIKNLRAALKNMESRQEFEDCALIRDRLKELENW